MSSNCTVRFWKNTDDTTGSGDNRSWTGPVNVPDFSQVYWEEGSTHDDMKDDASWVDTGSQGWVRIFSKANYQGRTALIGPGKSVNLKDVKDDTGSDDMNDTVESFQLYDHSPQVNTTDVNNRFLVLYPGSTHTRDNNVYVSEFFAQDSEYWIYDPVMELYDDHIAFTINLRHKQAENDDQATATFSMDFSGGFVDQIQVTYSMGSSAEVPKWAIKLVDGAIDVASDAAKAIADGAEIVITDGVGVVATVETNELIDFTAEALTFCIDHLNTVLKAVFELQDNGGTMYFSAIVSHAIARLIVAYHQTLLGSDPASPMRFNESTFLAAFGQSSWTNDKSNPYVNFTQDSYSYRSFFPDNTFLYGAAGAVSSVAVGANTNNEKDDHLILQCTYGPDGSLFSVVGGIDIFLLQTPNGYQAPNSGVVTFDKNRKMVHVLNGTVTSIDGQYGSLVSAYQALMAQALTAAGSEFGLSLSQQQQSLVGASVRVLTAITNAIG